MPVDNVPKLFCVFQPYPIQPAARHRDRMMMQGDQAMTPVRRFQGMLELSKRLLTEPAARGTRETAVEEHDPPGTEVAETTDSERVCPKFPAHDRRIVMIARYA